MYVPGHLRKTRWSLGQQITIGVVGVASRRVRDSREIRGQVLLNFLNSVVREGVRHGDGHRVLRHGDSLQNIVLEPVEGSGRSTRGAKCGCATGETSANIVTKLGDKSSSVLSVKQVACVDLSCHLVRIRGLPRSLSSTVEVPARLVKVDGGQPASGRRTDLHLRDVARGVVLSGDLALSGRDLDYRLPGGVVRSHRRRLDVGRNARIGHRLDLRAADWVTDGARQRLNDSIKRQDNVFTPANHRGITGGLTGFKDSGCDRTVTCDELLDASRIADADLGASVRERCAVRRDTREVLHKIIERLASARGVADWRLVCDASTIARKNGPGECLRS